MSLSRAVAADALGTAARLLLDDDAQLRFTAAECVEVKREHMARSIQAWWRYLTARRARYSPPLPRGGRLVPLHLLPVTGLPGRRSLLRSLLAR